MMPVFIGIFAVESRGHDIDGLMQIAGLPQMQAHHRRQNRWFGRPDRRFTDAERQEIRNVLALAGVPFDDPQVVKSYYL